MAIDKQKLLDPIDLELQSKYQELGITYLSNNNSVVNRDSAGNVVLIENESNPLLIIQPVVKQLINRSVIKVIDTQFNYFKFPVRVIQSPIDLDLDVEFGTDASYARYKPPYGYGEGEIPFNATSYDPVDFSEVVEGLPQISPSSYTISKEIKNSGIDLRFRIKINYRVDSDLPEQFAGFSIIKSGPDLAPQPQFRKFPDQESLNQYAVRNAELDIVILNSQFEIGTEFQIGAQSKPIDANHSINGGQSYWVITDAAKNVDLWNQEIE